MLARMLAGLSLVALLSAATSAPGPADPITGTWDMTFLVQGQTFPATMELKLHGHTVTGKISSAHTGEGKVTEGTWKNDTLAFVAVFEHHESIAVSGTIQEGRLAGQFTTEGFTEKWEAQRR